MNIKILDRVGFSEEEVLKLATHLILDRKPKEDSFDYTLETHGVFGVTFGVKLPYPIVVKQINKRVSGKSTIVIKIEKHIPIL